MSNFEKTREIKYFLFLKIRETREDQSIGFQLLEELKMRDSHKLLVMPYRQFERQFGGKTVLAGLRVKKV
jgi:hypothetical protein